MAEKLSVIIALEGAEEIKRQLADVGKAGKDAFAEINQAAAEVGGFNKLDPGVVTEKLKAAGDVGSEAFNKVATAVKQAGRMETLLNGIAAVENGFRAAGQAISGMGQALLAFIPSTRTLAKILVAVFSAATIGAIINTTKELLRLSDAALQAGVSIGDLAKAEGIFKAIGASSKEAADGAANFQEKMDLKNVKEAIANLDEFGRSASSTKDWFKILEEASKGQGEAAKLAQEFLEKLGRTKISGPAQDIDKITSSTGTLSDKILAMLTVFQGMENTTERNRLIFANFDKTLAGLIIRMLDAGISVADIKRQIDLLPAPTQGAINAATRLAIAWENLKSALAAPFVPSEDVVNFLARLLTGIANLRQRAQADLAAIGQFFAALPGQIAGFFAGFGTDLWANVVQSAQMTVDQIVQFFSAIPGQIAGMFAGFGAGLWDGIVEGAQSAWNQIVGFIETAIAKVREFLGMGGGQAAGAGAQGMARGGIIGGHGSGTSDSNLAWVSRGEHIMPARAVRQPGVLQLLEALRRSGGNLRGVLDRMGHFALGGMVSAPAFARGGAAGGMSNVTINFPGVQPITGLRASSAVVDELRRSAALAQVRAGGRKPSRYT